MVCITLKRRSLKSGKYIILVWLIWTTRVYAGLYEFPGLTLRKAPYLVVTRKIAKFEQSLLEIQKKFS
jgi:hypothetical protein